MLRDAVGNAHCCPQGDRRIRVRSLRKLLEGPIARGTIRTTFVLGLRLVVQAGTLLIVARMLGPSEFGAFAGIASLAVILGTLATFGTHLILADQVARDPSTRQKVLAYAVPTTLACGIILLVAFLAVCYLFLLRPGLTVGVLVAIGTAELLLQPAFTLISWEHLALGRVARSQLLTILPLALRLGAAATVLAIHPSDPLTPFSYGYFAASAAALVVATKTMPAPWPATRGWRLIRRKELRVAAGYAALAVTNMGSVELDKTLASALLPLSAAGIYAVATRIIGAAMQPVLAMLLAALPRLFREGEHAATGPSRLLRWLFATSVAYSVVVGAILWASAPLLVWLFGERYVGVRHAVHLLCLALPGLALRKAAGNILMGMGSPWIRVQFEATGLATLIAISAWIAPRYGISGMAAALICSEWAMAAYGGIALSATRRKGQRPAGA